MGTNIYAYVIPNELELIEFKTNVSKRINACNDIIQLKEFFETILDTMDVQYPKLHIGKRSGGYSFLFKQNKKHYDLTKKSIEDFLKRNNVLIIDEYGEHYSADKFWEEFGNCKAIDDKTRMVEKKYCLVTEEGLRFSYSEDFL